MSDLHRDMLATSGLDTSMLAIQPCSDLGLPCHLHHAALLVNHLSLPKPTMGSILALACMHARVSPTLTHWQAVNEG